jgi:hypothetical protein
MLKKVVRETRQTSSETITYEKCRLLGCSARDGIRLSHRLENLKSYTVTRELRSATNCPASIMTVRRVLRGMRFHGRAAAHKPNLSPVNAKRRLKWCEERRP